MKQIIEYLSTKIVQSKIKATDKTIKQIVKDELDRLGHDADLNHIDVSEVTNMTDLFNCYTGPRFGPDYKDLNPDISKWDVSKVASMESMFWNCRNFNCDISEWNVGEVRNMYGMFWDCKNFNQDISKWNVGKSRNMCYMFSGCKNFNQDISKWKVSNVWIMDNMFSGCKNFNQDISGWDVNAVTDYGNMFKNCPIKEEFKPKFKK